MKSKRLFIVLYGARSQGKTSTLMQLAINLAGGSSDVATSINSTFIKKGKYGDGRMILEYKGHFIYIATGGDSWAWSRGNAEFFEGDFRNQTIYEVNATGVRELSNIEKETFSEGKKSTVVVCACRPNGDKYGAIKALHAYNEKAISNYSEQIWLRKTLEDDNAAMAKEIQKRIDDFI